VEFLGVKPRQRVVRRWSSMAVLWISTSTWKRAAFRTVTGGRLLPRLLCPHHRVGRILPTIRWRVMRTFTPAAHEGANRADTRGVTIVQDLRRPGCAFRALPLATVWAQFALSNVSWQENWPLIWPAPLADLRRKRASMNRFTIW